MSPTLFNIFMDAYIEEVQKEVNSKREKKLVMTLFANVGKLQAHDRTTMQRALAASTDWARTNNMEWGLNKCIVLPRLGERHHNYQLGGRNIGQKGYGTYLGTQVTSEGMTDQMSIQGIDKAEQTLKPMWKYGISVWKIPSATVIQIVKNIHTWNSTIRDKPRTNHSHAAGKMA